MEPHLKSQLGLLLYTLLIIPFLTSAISTSSDPPTVYEILARFDLPPGLLPDSVKSYELSDDGTFVVELEKECYIQFDYLVYYEKEITGKLAIGSISNLNGIEVQRFLFWFDVDEIRVDLPPSDSIYFQVGIINRKLDVDQFLTVRSCRDGVSGSFHEACKQYLEVPNHVDEIPMLITE